MEMQQDIIRHLQSGISVVLLDRQHGKFSWLEQVINCLSNFGEAVQIVALVSCS